jgi:hypothetical protein
MPGVVMLDNLRVHHWALEFGGTTPTFAKNSYAYGLFGFGALSNAIDVIVDGYDTETITDGQGLVRFAGGVVIGITPTTGVDLGVSFDVVYAGTEEVGSGYGAESYPVTNEGILILSGGVIFDL